MSELLVSNPTAELRHGVYARQRGTPSGAAHVTLYGADGQPIGSAANPLRTRDSRETVDRYTIANNITAATNTWLSAAIPTLTIAQIRARRWAFFVRNASSLDLVFVLAFKTPADPGITSNYSATRLCSPNVPANTGVFTILPVEVGSAANASIAREPALAYPFEDIYISTQIAGGATGGYTIIAEATS